MTNQKIITEAEGFNTVGIRSYTKEDMYNIMDTVRKHEALKLLEFMKGYTWYIMNGEQLYSKINDYTTRYTKEEFYELFKSQQ